MSKTNQEIDVIYSTELTFHQRIRFAILCAMEVCADPKFIDWARKWLSGEDRSRETVGRMFSHGNLAVTYALGAAYLRQDYSGTSDDMDYAYGAYSAAALERRARVREEARQWSPENWEAVFEVWYKERKIDFSKLIEEAKS